MSAHNDALSREVDKARRAIREYEEQGRPELAVIAQARYEGLTFAQRLLFGDEREACAHRLHEFVRKDERGVNVWRCVACGEPYPAGATLEPVG